MPSLRSSNATAFNIYGWQGHLAWQRLRGAPMAIDQVRGIYLKAYDSDLIMLTTKPLPIRLTLQPYSFSIAQRISRSNWVELLK